MAIINGTSVGETLVGTNAADAITGAGGNDTLFGAGGNDLFIWNPGDGSDTIDGQAGSDTLQFDGAGVNERIETFASGSHAALFRDVSSITMDLNSVERIELNALGGTDGVTIDDLTGTAVKQVAVDLGPLDGQVDTVQVNAGDAANHIHVTQAGGTVSVTGLTETIAITDAEASDGLTLSGLGGDDTIDATALPAAALHLVLDGGAGNDTIVGGQGVDTIIGGDGNDRVTGGFGSDTAFLGAGDDRFIWNPGDSSDIVEGQAGFDTVQFDGANINEFFDVFANGSRLEATPQRGQRDHGPQRHRAARGPYSRRHRHRHHRRLDRHSCCPGGRRPRRRTRGHDRRYQRRHSHGQRDGQQ